MTKKTIFFLSYSWCFHFKVVILRLIFLIQSLSEALAVLWTCPLNWHSARIVRVELQLFYSNSASEGMVQAGTKVGDYFHGEYLTITRSFYSLNTWLPPHHSFTCNPDSLPRLWHGTASNLVKGSPEHTCDTRLPLKERLRAEPCKKQMASPSVIAGKRGLAELYARCSQVRPKGSMSCHGGPKCIRLWEPLFLDFSIFPLSVSLSF